jgi:hypothetical protein
MYRFYNDPTTTLMRALLAALGIAVLFPGDSSRIARADESEHLSSASSDPAFSAVGGFSTDPILSAIVDLESDHDAKCHSSASRFEDFLYGTPLSTEARDTNVELQKRLVRRLWSGASVLAAQRGDTTVRPPQLRRVQDEMVSIQLDTDVVSVEFPGTSRLEIPEIRFTQYASIAYSLRAILAVQQDFMISGGEPLLDLEPESIDALKKILDVVAMSVLVVADRDARARSEFEISESGLRSAWEQLLPGLADDGSTGHLAKGVDPPAPDDARARSLALLDRIVEGKASAYRTYNELGKKDTTPLFVFNIGRFYARTPIPPRRPQRRQLVADFQILFDEFTVELLADANRRARLAGHSLIRSEDAGAAIQHLVPHKIDEFEDVHVFYRLDEDDRVLLESFDCDSFRDFGYHWSSLQRAAHAAPPEAVGLDPFAAEILAEGISQYGVLLLRVSGTIAAQDTESIRITTPLPNPTRCASASPLRTPIVRMRAVEPSSAMSRRPAASITPTARRAGSASFATSR